MFKASIAFGADFGSIEFPARWLTRALPGSNESLRFYSLDLVQQAKQGSASEAERVRRIIHAQLVGGRPDAARAAALLGVHRRALARCLSAQSLRFKQLAQDLRLQMARESWRNRTCRWRGSPNYLAIQTRPYSPAPSQIGLAIPHRGLGLGNTLTVETRRRF